LGKVLRTEGGATDQVVGIDGVGLERSILTGRGECLAIVSSLLAVASGFGT